MGRKVLVVGLDSAPPRLVFDVFRDEMPTLPVLIARGAYGRLASTNPPITVPAWTAMMSSKDPGQLGCYGFRNRKDHSYDGYAFANSAQVKEPRLWDLLGARRQALDRPRRAADLSAAADRRRDGHLLPHAVDQGAVHLPREPEGRGRAGGRRLRARRRRLPHRRQGGAARARLRQDAQALGGRAAPARDRGRGTSSCSSRWGSTASITASGATWTRRTTSTSRETRSSTAIRDYYRYLDGELAALLDLVPRDTIVLVVSDHGSKRMDGGICFNEWLIREGYLTLKDPPTTPTPIGKVAIDWTQDQGVGRRRLLRALLHEREGSRARGHDRSGRLREGARRADRRHRRHHRPERDAASARRRFVPRTSTATCSGVAPDLIVYFGDLALALGRRRRHGRHPHLRERHRTRRGQPRLVRHLRAVERAERRRAPPVDRARPPGDLGDSRSTTSHRPCCGSSISRSRPT